MQIVAQREDRLRERIGRLYIMATLAGGEFKGADSIPTNKSKECYALFPRCII
jgi:hypothetical protein